jgi:hypothetical protein
MQAMLKNPFMATKVRQVLAEMTALNQKRAVAAAFYGWHLADRKEHTGIADLIFDIDGSKIRGKADVAHEYLDFKRNRDAKLRLSDEDLVNQFMVTNPQQQTQPEQNTGE